MTMRSYETSRTLNLMRTAAPFGKNSSCSKITLRSSASPENRTTFWREWGTGCSRVKGLGRMRHVSGTQLRGLCDASEGGKCLMDEWVRKPARMRTHCIHPTRELTHLPGWCKQCFLEAELLGFFSPGVNWCKCIEPPALITSNKPVAGQCEPDTSGCSCYIVTALWLITLGSFRWVLAACWEDAYPQTTNSETVAGRFTGGGHGAATGRAAGGGSTGAQQWTH